MASRKATPNYGTFKITKSGAHAKFLTTGHFALEQAQENCKYLESVNPGSKFVALPWGKAETP